MTQGSKIMGKLFGKHKKEEKASKHGSADASKPSNASTTLSSVSSYDATNGSSPHRSKHEAELIGASGAAGAVAGSTSAGYANSQTNYGASRGHASTRSDASSKFGSTSSSKGQVVSLPPPVMRQPLDLTYGGDYADGKTPTELTSHNTASGGNKALVDNERPRYDNDATPVKGQGQFFDPRDTQGGLYKGGSGVEKSGPANGGHVPAGVAAASASTGLAGGVAKGEYGEYSEATHAQLQQKNLKTKPTAYAEQEAAEKKHEETQTDAYNAGRRKGLSDAQRGSGASYGGEKSRSVDPKSEHQKNKSAYNEGGLAGATSEAKREAKQSTPYGTHTKDAYGNDVYTGQGSNSTASSSKSQSLNTSGKYASGTVASSKPGGYDKEIERLDKSIAETQKEIDALGKEAASTAHTKTLDPIGTTHSSTSESKSNTENKGILSAASAALGFGDDSKDKNKEVASHDDLNPSQIKASQAETSGVDNSKLEANIAAYNKKHGYTNGKSLIEVAEESYPEIKKEPTHIEGETTADLSNLQSSVSNTSSGLAATEAGQRKSPAFVAPAKTEQGSSKHDLNELESAAYKTGLQQGSYSRAQDQTSFDKSKDTQHRSHPVMNAATGKSKAESKEIEEAAFAAGSGKLRSLHQKDSVTDAAVGKSAKESREIEQAAQLEETKSGSVKSGSAPIIEVIGISDKHEAKKVAEQTTRQLMAKGEDLTGSKVVIDASKTDETAQAYESRKRAEEALIEAREREDEAHKRAEEALIEARKREDEARKREIEAKSIEARKQEDEVRKREEEARLFEARKREEEARKREEEARKIQEAAYAAGHKQAIEARKREEEARLIEARKREEEARKHAEEALLAARKLEEEARKREEEAKLIEARKREVEVFKREEEAKLIEARKLEEEARRREEEARKIQEAAYIAGHKQGTETRKREEEARLIEARKREEEARKRAEVAFVEAHKREDEARLIEARKHEEEARLIEARKLEEEARLIEARRREEEARLIEAKRREEEAKKIQEAAYAAGHKQGIEARKREEEARLIEARRREEEAKKIQEAAYAAGYKQGSETRKREEEARKIQEAAYAAGHKQGSETRKREEEARLIEARRREEEAKLIEARRREEEARLIETRKREEEAHRRAEEALIEARKREEEARKHEEEARLIEARKREEEARLIEVRRREEEARLIEVRRREEEARLIEARKREKEARKSRGTANLAEKSQQIESRGLKTVLKEQNSAARPIIEVIGISDKDEAQKVAQQTTRELIAKGEDLAGSKIVIDANKKEVYKKAQTTGTSASTASSSAAASSSSRAVHPDASFYDPVDEVDGSGNHRLHEKVKQKLEHDAEEGKLGNIQPENESHNSSKAVAGGVLGATASAGAAAHAGLGSGHANVDKFQKKQDQVDERLEHEAAVLGNIPPSQAHTNLAGVQDRKHSYSHRHELPGKEAMQTEVIVLGEPDTKRAQIIAQEAVGCLKGRRDLVSVKVLNVDAYTGAITDQDGLFIAQLSQRRLSQFESGLRRVSSGGLVTLDQGSPLRNSVGSGTRINATSSQGQASPKGLNEMMAAASKQKTPQGPFLESYDLTSAQGASKTDGGYKMPGTFH